MSKNYRQKLGYQGEQLALRYYRQQGYVVLARNLRCTGGEIDLLLSKNNQALIVEVKTRRNHRYGWAEETISAKKIRGLFFTYHWHQAKNNWPEDVSLEIMVIEINAGKMSFSIFNP